METLDGFLNLYGIAALFLLMLTKAAGVPVPVPSDLIMLAAAARAAEGKWPLWQAVVAILLALVLGGLIQYALARGPGRGLIARYGRYLGLTRPRLEAAATALRRGGVGAVTLAIVTPGVRAGAVVACGLADLPLRTFGPGLIAGSSLFLGLHVALGYVGAPLLGWLGGSLPAPWLLGAGLLLVGLAGWLVLRRRRRPGARLSEVAAEAAGAWHEAACPACLLLGALGPTELSGQPARAARPTA